MVLPVEHHTSSLGQPFITNGLKKMFFFFFFSLVPTNFLYSCFLQYHIYFLSCMNSPFHHFSHCVTLFLLFLQGPDAYFLLILTLVAFYLLFLLLLGICTSFVRKLPSAHSRNLPDSLFPDLFFPTDTWAVYLSGYH